MDSIEQTEPALYAKTIGDLDILLELNVQDRSPMKTSGLKYDSSDEEEPPLHRKRKRIQQLCDSDTDKENCGSNSDEDIKRVNKSEEKLISSNSRGKSKSRIQISKSSSDSDHSDQHEVKTEQKIRMINKRNKVKQKFKELLTSRSKLSVTQNESNINSTEETKSVLHSGYSDSESTSVFEIKQKIKKSIVAATAICDPDTSDDEEENVTNKITLKRKPKKVQKSTKVIEAQPMKMTAKEAMENMQLIKSESNRMLREKAVSLPYHKPKALSLKDIMSRRKPALSSDGKILPIKMNEEQLQQYVLQLEQRQKEMMELCKSESDEDMAENNENVNNIPISETDNKNELKNNLEQGKEHLDLITDDIIDKESDNIIDKVENTDHTNTENNLNENLSTDPNNLVNTALIEENLSEPISTTGQHEIENNMNNSNNSNTDMKLVYNDDSIEEENTILDKNGVNTNECENIQTVPENQQYQEITSDHKHVSKDSELDSQSVQLHYTDTNTEESYKETRALNSEGVTTKNSEQLSEKDKEEDFLSDDDIDMEDIDKIIENAEIMKENEIIQIPDRNSLNMQPRLTGVPGMMIDLDDADSTLRKRSGIELLKEKFTYFSKLKTPEEQEREREKRLKPGAQHLKLKHELEEKLAEQRSLEWAKRLEEEKQHQKELDTILDDAEDSIEKIEQDETELNEQEESEQDAEESEEELLEDDIEVKDKVHKHNPLIDDEAEESDAADDDVNAVAQNKEEDIDNGEDDVEDNSCDEENNDSSEDDESSESEEENQISTVRKSRILKAFEDSDEEDVENKQNGNECANNFETNNEKQVTSEEKIGNDINDTQQIAKHCRSQCFKAGSSQDDVIQLAQRHISASDDLFTSQENSEPNNDDNDVCDLGTQTFSISNAKTDEFLCPSLPYVDSNIKAIADGFSQNLLESQPRSTQSESIGEDILDLCTGKFYDNEFISQSLDNKTDENSSQDPDNINNDVPDNCGDSKTDADDHRADTVQLHVADNDKNRQKIDPKTDINNKMTNDGNLLKSILDELGDAEFDKPKPNKYFSGEQNKSDAASASAVAMKKRLVIDSDDEMDNTNEQVKRMKKKKKKLEDRALQFSDDDDEMEEELESQDEYESEIEDDAERIVEYDSEENEIEVKPDKPKKKKQKASEFFEQEAELTSEDEWVGSGDEDEQGLDRMEREEGDDEVFHQGKLRNELGQIHMRDVLDQDKREVRLLQELLFEDGDLGGGHRQRKFRWKNTEDEEAGTIPKEFTDTQEEEMESEEQWRKQRHEREVFLRQMQQQEDEAPPNVTVNRTTIIKANLTSKSMSALLMEVNQSKTQVVDSPPVEKKSVKDVPSPKKTFSILRQNYQGSLLSRGRGALERLAALATPLAADEDAPKVTSVTTHKRNFVFSALTPDDTPKVTIKRKAEVSTPQLVKKMRIEERHSRSKNSLLDHFNL